LEPEIRDLLETRQRFERESQRLRPDLHRFCARMTGSVSDGEDVVQEALVHAFYHLPELREGTSLRSWLFRIAHNRCVDFLRRRRTFLPLDEAAPASEDVDADFEHKQVAQSALATIFTQLPPKERAAIVLKDVLGYSLEETAEVTSSNVNAVKAAVHRARQKLLDPDQAARVHAPSPAHTRLIETYLERFNQRDWAGVRALLSEDARLEVVQRVEGPFAGASYFQNYSTLGWEWRLAWASVEGAPAVVHFRRVAADWQPHSVVVFAVEDDRITLIRDYVHVDYLLRDARVERTPAST
jgi:RNA polymerase sigma-70 factor (ECF subfamily)